MQGPLPEGVRGEVLNRLRAQEARRGALRRLATPALAAAAVLLAVLGIVVARHGFQESAENAPPLSSAPQVPGAVGPVEPREPAVRTHLPAIASAPEASRDPAASGPVPVAAVARRASRRLEPELIPVKTSEGIVLTWKGLKGRSEYRILRSDRPDFATAEVDVVAGTKWVDRGTPGGSRITYYRIE